MEILVNAIVSVGVGVGLWLFLPRGVVLIAAVVTAPDLYNTWTICNDSPLPVRLVRVTASGVSFIDDEGKIITKKLPPAGFDDTVWLFLNDESSEIGREDWSTPWDEVTLGPGETMTAYVNLNHRLHIRYRRAGWCGVLERRSLLVQGGI